MSRKFKLLTPESLVLDFEVANAGDRIVAFLIDYLLVLLACFLIGMVAFLAFWALGLSIELALAVVLVANFVIRNFYFMFFEMRRSGTTPGKRHLGVRVIARDGGTLTPEMIFSRNLTRELEVFLPVTVFFAPQLFFGEQTGWGVALAMLWFLGVALLPVFGKNRLRCGDLVAGTIVVYDPKPRLTHDLTTVPPRNKARRFFEKFRPVEEDSYTFTPEQLDLYGVHELQTLEDVLRNQEKGRAAVEVLEAISDRIRKKIGWPPGREVGTLPFLRAFYKAQRARLEQQILMGKRREKKVSRRLGDRQPPPPPAP